MKITEEVTYMRVPVVGNLGADEFVPVRRELVAREDETKPALRVTSLLESEAFRRRCSDAFLRLPKATNAVDRLVEVEDDVAPVGDDLYSVCDVLPQDPTDDQLGDLAFRFSGFLEDLRSSFLRELHVIHVDGRRDASDVRALSVPMRSPISDRCAMAAHRDALLALSDGSVPPFWPTARETFCATYLEVPRWMVQARLTFDDPVRFEPRELVREQQLWFIDGLARRRGLRCVEIGVIPEP